MKLSRLLFAGLLFLLAYAWLRLTPAPAVWRDDWRERMEGDYIRVEGRVK